MTPKEKAKELVLIFGKVLALICVNEIIDFGTKAGLREPIMFWNTVKKEINKL